MRSPKDIFEEFNELAEGRVAFALNDSTYYEGYLYFIYDNTFTFFIGGPLAPDEPIEIKISDVDLNSMCYWSDSERKWKTAKWKHDAGKWEIKDATSKN
ncbi:MAG: hypothetical protein N2484_06250 [Clostridia bacterium]|nr:hypothetical protein [Clostridia bacterium]